MNGSDSDLRAEWCHKSSLPGPSTAKKFLFSKQAWVLMKDYIRCHKLEANVLALQIISQFLSLAF